MALVFAQLGERRVRKGLPGSSGVAWWRRTCSDGILPMDREI